MMKTEELKLVAEWDKTFPKSDKVNRSFRTFWCRKGAVFGTLCPDYG